MAWAPTLRTVIRAADGELAARPGVPSGRSAPNHVSCALARTEARQARPVQKSAPHAQRAARPPALRGPRCAIRGCVGRGGRGPVGADGRRRACRPRGSRGRGSVGRRRPSCRCADGHARRTSGSPQHAGASGECAASPATRGAPAPSPPPPPGPPRRPTPQSMLALLLPGAFPFPPPFFSASRAAFTLALKTPLVPVRRRAHRAPIWRPT
mmetsp:Transcript_2267/g.7462  ORF Transcript_2267/g.7462 Transcript_2267/m.7462 type:complete len:211 (-) Transcript_2267:172-804(-)